MSEEKLSEQNCIITNNQRSGKRRTEKNKLKNITNNRRREKWKVKKALLTIEDKSVNKKNTTNNRRREKWKLKRRKAREK